MQVPRRTGVAILLAGLVFVFAWFFRFNDPGGAFGYLTDDHFFYIVRGWQMLFGDLPVRDFVDHGAPLHYYVAAAVQQIGGRGTLSEFVFCVTMLAAGASVVFLLAWRASGSFVLGLIAAAVHIVLEPRYYNYPKIIVYAAAIPALWRFIDHPGHRRVAVLAAITVVGFLFRHDHGVYLGAAFAVSLVCLPAMPWRSRVGAAASYALVVLVLLAPYLVFLQRNGGIADYFQTAATWAERDRDRAEVVWPGLSDNPDGVSAAARDSGVPARQIAQVQDNAVAWLFYAELALPLLALVVIVATVDAGRHGWPNARVKLGVVAVLGLLLDAGFLRSPLAARLADPSVPLMVLLAWLPVGLAGVVRADRRRPGMPSGVARALAIAGVLLIGVTVTAASRGVSRRLETTRIAGGIGTAFEQAKDMWIRIGGAFPATRETASESDDLMMLAVYLRECTTPTDRIFMQQYLPQVLAMGERGFAGGHADLRPGFFQDEANQRLTLDRLRRQSVPVALLGGGDELGGFRKAFPLIVGYFDTEYVTGGERTLDDRFPTRLLIRKDAVVTGRFAPWGWPCFR